MLTRNLLFALLPGLTAAHFQLLSPPARGYDEDTLTQYPCGGQNSVSNNRTKFPISDAAIQLNMEHDRAAVQVVLALGETPGDGDFNITVRPIFLEEGIGKFCMGDVSVALPSGTNVGDQGLPATLQVITNGDPSGGLYNCADITLMSSGPAGQCTNGTGIMATSIKSSTGNANSTSDDGDSSASGSPSASGGGSSMTASATAAGGSSTHNAAARMGLVGGNVVGGVTIGTWEWVTLVVLAGATVGGGWIVW